MERWKSIPGYEGFYEVSDCGNIKRLEHTDRMGHTYKERLVKCGDGGRGYKRVHLSRDGVAKWELVHRLVADAFCAKPEGMNVVNHIDNNPGNNHYTNLEWTDYKGNMQHATKQGRMHYNPENLKKAIESRKKPVVGRNGEETLRFESAAAARSMGFNSKHISSCCNNRYGYKTHKGYTWRYAE